MIICVSESVKRTYCEQARFALKSQDMAEEILDAGEPLNLDNQLCFALYVCSKEVIRRYKPLLDPLGLTYTSYITMLALWEQDGVQVKDLGKRLFLDSGTLTPLLKKMEKEGLVNRKRSESDERTVFISLTEKGRALQKKCAGIPAKMAGCSRLEKDSAHIILACLHSLMKGLTMKDDEEK